MAFIISIILRHSALLKPKAECQIHKTGVSDFEKDFILRLHNEYRQRVIKAPICCNCILNNCCISPAYKWNTS